MKKVVFTLSAISAAILVWSFANAAGDSKAEITAIEHKIIAATSADELMPLYDEKEVVLYDYIAPLQYTGATAVRANFDKAFSNAKNLKGKFLELKVVADEKMGVAHSLQHFTWTDKDGKPGEGTFRVTDCFHKVNGQWKVFHTHISFPIDPATGKAEMNLKK